MTDALVEAVRSAMTSYLLENVSPDTVRVALQAIEAAGYRVVPVEATEGQWDGLARQIIMWMDMHPKTPRALFAHLKNTGHDIPQWLRDEPEMKHLDHVPSKGTRAVIIYRAMLSAAPRVGDI